MKTLADLSKEEQASLRDVVCQDCSDAHINYYLQVCASQSVNPFSGQLYLTVRSTKGKLRPIVASSIDGARAKASRCDGYAGSDEPEYDSEDQPTPKWCRSTVYRMVHGERCPFTSKLRWEEFKPAPPNDFQWKAKPYHMLAKCAEMASLRKAFPEAVQSGGEEEYTDESGTESVGKKAEDATSAPVPLAARWANALSAFKPYSVDEKALLAYVKKSQVKDLTAEDFDTLHHWYEELQREVTPT